MPATDTICGLDPGEGALGPGQHFGKLFLAAVEEELLSQASGDKA